MMRHVLIRIDYLTRMSRRTRRRAVTLVEVIFSIGVVLIGMLGLLSILPLAGRRAQDSLSLNIGSAVSDTILSRLESSHSLSKGEFLALDSVAGTAIPLTGTPSFVIDPLFVSSYEQLANISNSDGVTVPPTATSNGYSENFFPYFKTNHNPYFDPHDSLSTDMTNQWTSPQPRLLRSGITRRNLVLTGFPSRRYLDAEQARSLVERHDDLPIDRSKDGSKPSTFFTFKATNTAQLEYGKRIPTGEYTWIATVNPLPGGVYASISVVVMRKRERSFVAPDTILAVTDPKDNSLSERLAYVNFASGFFGGAGGLVHLVASDKTPANLSENDWIMLSRTDGVNNFHRWYRVVSVDSEVQRGLLPNPVSGTDQPVWQHKVLLDGPDWQFGFATPGPADAVFVDNTLATLVENVVSVTERVVLLSDL